MHIKTLFCTHVHCSQMTGKVWENVSSDAKDLMIRMLDRNVKTRITVEECIEHCWIKVIQLTPPYITSMITM